MLLQNIWHMFKYLLKTQIRCFFTTYSHAGQKWNFRFLPQSNFLTTELFNEDFLARSSFLVKNFLQNQSSTSQLYIALSAINKYEILFWTDSSEKCKKMAKSANPPLQIIFQIWSEKIENLNFLKQILQQSQNASSSETMPLSPVFSHTYLFTIVWELLKISIFYPEIAFSWPQNASIIWRHLLFDPMSS